MNKDVLFRFSIQEDLSQNDFQYEKKKKTTTLWEWNQQELTEQLTEQ